MEKDHSSDAESIADEVLPPGVSIEQVQEHVAQILASEGFSGSHRLQDFLRFVVDEALEGRGNRIKGFTVAEAIFEADESFDPQSSAIVRVEAGRLRRRLAEFYLEEGRNSTLQISVPKGGYVPEFSVHQLYPSDSGLKASEEQLFGIRKIADRPVAAVVAIGICITVIAGLWISGGNHSTEQVAPQNATLVAQGNTAPGPFIVVAPFTTVSGGELESRIVGGLLESIVTDLTKLSDMSVMAHGSLNAVDTSQEALESINREYGVTHVLRGSLERENETVRINVQLVDAQSGVNLWAERFDGTANSLLDIQDELVQLLITNLEVELVGGEKARVQRQHTSNPEALTLYRQGLVMIMSPDRKERVQAARQLFQRVVDIDPNFAGGYAGLSFTHIVGVLFLASPDPKLDLGNGISLGLKAIETDEQFGAGYAVLALAYALAGRYDESRFHGNKAAEVQPGDAFSRLMQGMSLMLAGQPEDALKPLELALALDPAEPRTPYRNVIGLCHFANEDYARADRYFEENISIDGPRGPHIDLLRLLTRQELDQQADVKMLSESLKQNYSTFPFEKWLAWWIKDEQQFERFVDRLGETGLTTSTTSSSQG